VHERWQLDAPQCITVIDECILRRTGIPEEGRLGFESAGRDDKGPYRSAYSHYS
jgi:hypothetical protein